MKPIEVGCKVVVIGARLPSNVGKTGIVIEMVPPKTVIRFGGEVFEALSSFGWLVEADDHFNSYLILPQRTIPSKYGAFKNNNLLRLDNDEDFKEDISIYKEDVHSPLWWKQFETEVKQ